MNINISRIENPSDREIEQIQQIIDICNSHDGTSYDFDSEDDYRKPGEANYFILYGDGEPLSAIYLFAPTSAEAEVYAFTKPEKRRQGYISAILKEVAAEVKGRAIPSLLLVCDGNSKAGKAFIDNRKFLYEYSEFSMSWEPPLPEIGFREIDIRPVREEDREELIQINSEAFGDERSTTIEIIDLFFSSDKRDFYAVTHNGAVVGMIGRYLEESRDYIHGFAMDKAVRGKGWGRQALLLMVGICRQSDPERSIVLEVETENERALGLYKRCGFRLVSRFGYYREVL